MSCGGEVSMVECLGPGSRDMSHATSRWFGYFIRTRISASRHDSRQEPYAVVPHVRICAGGGEQSPSLPRSAHLSRSSLNADEVARISDALQILGERLQERSEGRRVARGA